MPEHDMHEGGCLCSQLRFRTVGAPRFIAICHCRYCQKLTGSAFKNEVAFLKENVAFLGEVREFEYRSPAHDKIMRSHFCPNCGVTVGLSFERFAAVQAILAGTFDDPSWVRFDKHIFTASALPRMAYPESMDLFSGHCLAGDGSLRMPDRPKMG